MEAAGRAHFQGTLREDFLRGLRQVTKNHVVFHFSIDKAAGRVRVRAVIFGGQDHSTWMLRRIRRSGV